MIVLRTGSRLMLIYSYINMSLLSEAQKRKGHYTSGDMYSNYQLPIFDNYSSNASEGRHLAALFVVQGFDGLVQLHLELISGLLLP